MPEQQFLASTSWQKESIVSQNVSPDTGSDRPARIGPASHPADIVAWSLDHFADRRMLMSTQFGMEGCAVIDMVGQTGRPLEIVYLDTMFFFPETLELRDRLAKRYPQLRIINRGTDLTPEQQAEKYGPELWKTNPDLCCHLRKVEPMLVVMDDVEVWLTGLRRSQSAARANLQTIEWDWRHALLKVNPLANWSRQQVWEYIQEHDVPYNPLHEKGYPTVGCTHCTKSIEGAKIGEYSRAGRWSGTDKTECGLHGDGI
jgi:phosphoadenosine phosphosulfate reductase